MKCYLLLLLCVGGFSSATFAQAKTRPLMREFMGLNGHFQFRPELYSQTCRLARNYHSLNWDVDPADVSRLPRFPIARNRVNWDTHVYGKWKRHGFEIDACLMFDVNDKSPRVQVWAKKPKAAFEYGKQFARFFGPSGQGKFITSAEIGNEPGSHVDDATYREVFEQMARGLRAGDPKIKIVTCAATALKADQWSKNLDAFKGLEELYDVVNVHQYAQVEGWPTWRRSYPEDRSINYLNVIQSAIDWRDQHAAGKQVWLTEFGYDSATSDAIRKRKKPYERWVGVTDTQQAQWIVRSFLLFSAMDLHRAYLYFFNDSDKASPHAAAGLTRNFKPKPSFHAMAHLYQTLGDYRFERIVQVTKDGLHVYSYRNPSARILVAWIGSGESKRTKAIIPTNAAKVRRATRMPLKAGEAESVTFKSVDGGIELEVGGSPVYLWIK